MDLLTYPEYVIFKGMDTIIDEKRIRLGLKLNVYTAPFNLKTFTQTIKRLNNTTDIHNKKWLSAKNVQEKITTSTNQKNTIKDNKHHKESTKQEEY